MAKFDLKRFDIKLGTKNLHIAHYSTNRFEGFYGLGKAVFVAHDGITQIVSSVAVNNAARTAHTDITSFYDKYKLQRAIKTNHYNVNLFTQNYKVSKNCEAKQTGENVVKSNYSLNKIIYHKAKNNSKVTSECKLTRNGYVMHINDTMFLGYYTIEKIKEDFVTINIEIPPNGELRIDGENFTVVLNRDNVLHFFEGEFPMLTKDVISMEIAALNGVQLTGEIFYKERYL